MPFRELSERERVFSQHGLSPDAGLDPSAGIVMGPARAGFLALTGRLGKFLDQHPARFYMSARPAARNAGLTVPHRATSDWTSAVSRTGISPAEAGRTMTITELPNRANPLLPIHEGLNVSFARPEKGGSGFPSSKYWPAILAAYQKKVPDLFRRITQKMSETGMSRFDAEGEAVIDYMTQHAFRSLK